MLRRYINIHLPAQVYGDSMVVTEEQREFELPDMDKPWLRWQFTR